MEKEKDSKKTLITLAIILGLILFVAGFFLIGGGEEEPATTVTDAVQTDTSIIGADALRNISKIKSLKLDDNFFDNPNFIGLEDRVQDVVTESVGRTNPFSEIR